MKAFLWFLFSATATLSAFILPVHLFALWSGFELNLATVWHRMYFFILMEAAFYHSLYRVKTIVFDLGGVHIQKPLGIILIAVFGAATLASLQLIFWNL